MGALEDSVEAMLEEQKKVMIGNSIDAFNLGVSTAGLKTTDEDRTEAEEAYQDGLANDLIEAIIATIEAKATIECDENEDGKFTYIEIDTPDVRAMLKDDILEYRLGTK